MKNIILQSCSTDDSKVFIFEEMLKGWLPKYFSSYSTSSEFKFKKYRKLGKIPELASHYEGILLIIFENDVHLNEI
jgi:hypothetical protein